MKKLSTLIRRENCFFTIDNHVLKTVQDFLEYLMECDEGSYIYHVNSKKNDFAKWVNDVLLFPELSESLKISKNMSEARDAVMEFFQVFDYRSKSIPEEKVFHTVDDYNLKNIQELYYYINNCDDGSFRYHVNDKKNDFANWVSDVLLFPALSAKIRAVNDKLGTVAILKEFLLTSKEFGANPEYERYINERLVHDNVQNTIVYQKSESAKSEPTLSSLNLSSTSSSSAISSSVPSKIVEETINLDKKFEYVREEEPEKAAELSFDKSNFRQFTDDELEKFVSFSKKETVVDTDMKVEYLKTVLQELKNMIRDLRRAEKDALIADLMLRTIDAKINYYALSKNVEDYNHIIRLMKDVQAEIEDSSEHHSYNIAEEILKDLRLQGIAMKKA